MATTIAPDTRTTSSRRRWMPGDLALLIGPAVLALVLSVLLAGRPSYWLDETATIAAVHRPVPGLVHVLRQVDAVHGVFYLLMWPWARVSLDENWLRFPSALAAAGGTLAVVGIGWQLLGRRTATVAGILYATLPLVSYDGSTVRSQALYVMFAAGATFFLVMGARTRKPAWWVVYALAMSAGIAVFLFSALVLVAHVGYLAVTARRRDAAAGLVLPAITAVVMAGVTHRQSGQLSLRRLPLRQLPRFAAETWFSDSSLLAWVAAALVVAGAVLLVRAPAHRGPAVLLVTLAVGPTVLLWLASWVQPVLTDRYVVASAVGIALLAGHAISRVRSLRAVVLLVAVLIGLGLPGQITQRQVDGRGPSGSRDDPRDALAMVHRDHRPDDVLAYTSGYSRAAVIAYPELAAGIPDISAKRSAAAAGSLYGDSADVDEFTAGARTARRVWLITYQYGGGGLGAQQGQVDALTGLGFREVSVRHYGRSAVDLFQR